MPGSIDSKRLPDLLKRLLQPRNRHWLLLAYWPFYTVAYFAIGRLGGRTAPVCVSGRVDALIPFCACFIVPYLLWFPVWIGMLAYALFREPRLFKRMMHFLMLTFSTAVLIFWLFPTTPGLRPEHFATENLCTALTRFVYRVDADVNACPSEHIIGLFATVFAVWDSQRLKGALFKPLTLLTACIIAASTVLVKQHALLDLAAAAVLSAIGWLVCFYLPRRRDAAAAGTADVDNSQRM